MINGEIFKHKKNNFDFEWKFNKGDSNNANEKDFDDSGWSDVNLPHDWSIEGPIDKKNAVHKENEEFYLSGCSGYLPYGTGWYRKKFHVSWEDENKTFIMQFDGIYRKAEIFINGEKAFYQIDGYTSFYIDITKYIIYGSQNSVSVRVNNDVGSRWYSGSGIYRHVWLIKTDKLHIKNWGTYITASNVSPLKSDVNVLTEIKNDNNENKIFGLETVIFDKDDNVVSKKTDNDLEIKQNGEIKVSQDFILSNPVLWSEDHPVRYKVINTIFFQSQAIDSYESYFGIRSIKLDNKKGLLINGKAVKMKGVCLHHDGGPVGAAVPEKVLERRLVKLKEIGCNSIRTSHNQYSPEFYEMCDKMGIYVMHEFCDKWFGSHYPDFENQWKKDFDLQIALLRNHPSIIFYSIGNENTSPYDNDNPDYENDWFFKTTNELGDYVRSKDPSRIITQG